jgi:hypothetical protein
MSTDRFQRARGHARVAPPRNWRAGSEQQATRRKTQVGNIRVRFVVTVFAAMVLAASVIVAQSSRTGAQRPVRALGAGANADPDAVSVDVTDVGVARPIEGKTARAHSVRLGRGYTSVPSSRSWSTREQFLGGEEGEELKPRANPSVGRSDVTDDVERPLGGGGTTITLGTGFAGLRQVSNGGPNTWSVPPDTVGDVGDTVYVQAVNTVYAVYDKATGAKVFGPASQSDLYDPATQSICASHDDGDPIVVYDEAAGRFVLSQFALNFNTNTYYECIAVSQDGDPTQGDWHAYQFEYPIQALNDYPKFGVWPDGYYASFNQFRLNKQGNFVWRGAGAIAYERSAMINGDPAQQLYVDLWDIRQDLGGLLPSDWDSPDAPPAGMPNLFLMFDADDAFWGYTDDQVELWAFDADFTTPGNSTFEQVAVPSNNLEGGLDVGNFNPWVCGAPKLACIPQKNSSLKLDTISDRLMNRLQYWNDGTTQHLVVNHTVKSNDGGAGVRWYDFENATQNANSTAWGVGNQGTYGPGPLSRWMGSAAMNDLGDLAVGYSTSKKKKFPGIGVAARTTADAAKTLGAELKFYTGNGSEKGNFNRWGDYSAMSVDPTDHCTFWYTQQYYVKTGQWKWATRIQPFTVSACV